MITKICFKCGIEQPLTSFHKHKQMKDGHLNKCASCVVKDVDLWRKKNPDCRIKENRRSVDKRGGMDRPTWLKHKTENAMGKKVVSNNYAHRRRMKVTVRDELTDFVFAEASILRDMRKETTGINWHIDHIVPINHKDACGLHVAANFQVVPAKWNKDKRHFNMDLYFG